MNKYKLYMIFGIVLLGLSITGSLAYYIWSSSTTSISGNLCLPEIYFTGGATINSKLKPVSSKEEGLIKEVEVNLHKTCNNDTAVMNLYLSLDLLPTALQENTFVYELYNGNNERISSGNFSDKKQGDTITLASNEIVTSNVSIYTLYIYIDGNRDNPITMSNNNFRFNIYGEGTGAIYKENVMQNETTQPSSSSSTFLNTEVLRNQIESITIEKNNIVPSDAKYSKDISSKQDGSVMLWYTDKDNNNLYEVSIGSENGSLEANTNGSGMFSYLDNVDTLDLTGLNTSNMTSMRFMFYKSTSLKNIDVSGFDTSKVVNMDYMFNGCNNLESLNLANFNTSNVTSMYWMFGNVEKVNKLDLSSFNTSKVTDMTGMFRYCNNLVYLDLSSFNTSKVTNMSGMFLGCQTLKNLDLSSFNTSNVTNMGHMFQECRSLIELNLSSFDTSKVTDMTYMFMCCNNLESLNLSSFNTSNVSVMLGMFNRCSSLINLDLSNFSTLNVTNMNSMFWNCSSLTNIIISSSFNTSKVTNMDGMFGGCSSLVGIELSSFDTSKVTDMGEMFENCTQIKTLDLTTFDTSNVKSMNRMFSNNTNLKTIYVSEKWNTSNVTNSTYMFRNCNSLIGAVSYDYTKQDVSMANYTNGYLTYKASSN